MTSSIKHAFWTLVGMVGIIFSFKWWFKTLGRSCVAICIIVGVFAWIISNESLHSWIIASYAPNTMQEWTTVILIASLSASAVLLFLWIFVKCWYVFIILGVLWFIYSSPENKQELNRELRQNFASASTQTVEVRRALPIKAVSSTNSNRAP